MKFRLKLLQVRGSLCIDSIYTDISVLGAYDIAIATGLFTSDPEQIVPLFLARVGYERRKISAGIMGIVVLCPSP